MDVAYTYRNQDFDCVEELWQQVSQIRVFFKGNKLMIYPRQPQPPWRLKYAQARQDIWNRGTM